MAALVIGNSGYPDGNDLKNPVNDATDLAAKLQGYGFDAVRPQMGEHRLDDRFAAIRGPCRVRADPKTGPPVGETEAPEVQ
jgi:hypothetical protein